MGLNTRHVARWGDYQTRTELVLLCSGLPVLPRPTALAFFDEAEKITENGGAPRETTGYLLFEQLGSTLVASDRPDFDVRWELESQSVADGVLMVETYDRVMPSLQCVARIGDDSYLTRTYMFRDVMAVKRLQGLAASGLVGH